MEGGGRAIAVSVSLRVHSRVEVSASFSALSSTRSISAAALHPGCNEEEDQLLRSPLRLRRHLSTHAGLLVFRCLFPLLD